MILRNWLVSVKQIVKKLLLSPVGAPIRNRYRGLGSILLYHRVTDDSYSPGGFFPQSGIAVERTAFRQQMEFLSSNYTCVSLNRIVNILRRNEPIPSGRPLVAITFDDGYRDNLEIALPILEEFSIPVTIFVTTGFIEGTHEPWWLQTGALVAAADTVTYELNMVEHTASCKTVADKYTTFLQLDSILKSLSYEKQELFLERLFASHGERPTFYDQFLRWDELRELHKHPLITLGAHTISHASLAACSQEELEFEINESKQIVEEALSTPINFFAYPYGKKSECSTREFSAAEQAGLDASFTTRSGHVQNAHATALHAIPRLAVDYYMSLQDIDELILSGLASLLRRKGEIFVTD